MTKRKTKFYVAVIVRQLENEPLIRSLRSSGDFASFVGTDKTKVVEQALKAAASWGAYDVYVGELTERAETLKQFKMTRI